MLSESSCEIKLANSNSPFTTADQKAGRASQILRTPHPPIFSISLEFFNGSDVVLMYLSISSMIYVN